MSATPGGAPRQGRTAMSTAAAFMAGLALVIVVAISWFPDLNEPFGDSHDGRVNARHALQARNFHRAGLVGSGYASDTAPLAGRYYSHPPMSNTASVVVSYLPGEHEYQARLFPFLMGAATIPFAYLLLRGLDVGRLPSLLSVALIAASPTFWLYGRLLWDTPFLFAAPAALLWLRRGPTRPSRWLAAVVMFLSPIASWIAGLTALAHLGLAAGTRWISRRDATLLVAAFGAGLLLTLAWVEAAGSVVDLVANRAVQRSTSESLTVTGFVNQLAEHIGVGLPGWLFLLGAFGIGRTSAHGIRKATLGVATATSLAWIFGFPFGAFVHNYWIYPLLVPVLILVAGGLERLLEAARRPRPVAALVATLALAMTVWMAAGPIHDVEFGPAGKVASAVEPPPGQAVAWTIGPNDPRYLHYYWDLPDAALPANDFPGRPSDLVFVRTDSVETVLGPLASRLAYVVRHDPYGVVRADDVLALIDEVRRPA